MNFLSEKECNEINLVIQSTYEKACSFWEENPLYSLEKLESHRINDSQIIPSSIPGNNFVSTIKSKKEELFSFCVDIRKSTEILKSHYHNEKFDNGLHKIYLITSVLLPAIEKIINIHNGSVTEYLGDGLLAFFPVEKDQDQTIKKQCYYNISRSVKKIIYGVLPLVNLFFKTNMDLSKDILVGIGVSRSEAIIHAVGYGDILYPKAFGECVFEASKLANISNNTSVYVSDIVYKKWPVRKSGGLSFTKETLHAKHPYLKNIWKLNIKKKS